MGDDVERDWEYVNQIKDYTHWSKRKNRFYPTNATHTKLPSGVYEARIDNEDNVYAREIKFPSDSLLALPGMPTDLVVGQIKEFWGRESMFKEMGLLFKRGILLYGPAGCGKTSIIRLLCDEIIRRDGIVISVTKIETTSRIIQHLREIEPARPIMTIFEDIEKMMDDKEQESDVLSFLDGEKQVNNIVHLATTNKPDILEDRLIKRPGRFDLIIGLNSPIISARKIYLEYLIKSNATAEQIQQMANDTDGMGLAHLRELVVATICFNADYKMTLKRLQNNVKDVIKMPKMGQKSTVGYTLGFTPGETTQDTDI